ncbi:hypothetical protein V6N13_048288 [Hibiscus sabdariffa]
MVSKSTVGDGQRTLAMATDSIEVIECDYLIDRTGVKLGAVVTLYVAHGWWLIVIGEDHARRLYRRNERLGLGRKALVSLFCLTTRWRRLSRLLVYRSNNRRSIRLTEKRRLSCQRDLLHMVLLDLPKLQALQKYEPSIAKGHHQDIKIVEGKQTAKEWVQFVTDQLECLQYHGGLITGGGGSTEVSDQVDAMVISD